MSKTPKSAVSGKSLFLDPKTSKNVIFDPRFFHAKNHVLLISSGGCHKKEEEGLFRWCTPPFFYEKKTSFSKYFWILVNPPKTTIPKKRVFLLLSPAEFGKKARDSKAKKWKNAWATPFFCVSDPIFWSSGPPKLSVLLGVHIGPHPPSRDGRILPFPWPIEWFPQELAGANGFKPREKSSLIIRQKSSHENPSFFSSKHARFSCSKVHLNPKYFPWVFHAQNGT